MEIFEAYLELHITAIYSNHLLDFISEIYDHNLAYTVDSYFQDSIMIYQQSMRTQFGTCVRPCVTHTVSTVTCMQIYVYTHMCQLDYILYVDLNLSTKGKYSINLNTVNLTLKNYNILKFEVQSDVCQLYSVI